MILKVLGTGCAKCKKLEENTLKAIGDSGVSATVEKVTELKDIMAFGVMMTPALVIDEKVVASGKLLAVEDILKLIKLA